jgi:host factor-I protein
MGGNMDKAKINVQDQVLNISRKERIPVEITLIGGADKMRGLISSFDGYCVFLKLDDHREIMIYKHAIATLLPLQPLPINRRENLPEE